MQRDATLEGRRPDKYHRPVSTAVANPAGSGPQDKLFSYIIFAADGESGDASNRAEALQRLCRCGGCSNHHAMP